MPDPTPTPAATTHFVACSSLAAFFEDLEFAQLMLQRDGGEAARAFAMGSANVFVDCADRAGFDASVAVGEENNLISAVIKIKSPRSSFSGTFRTKRTP